MKLRIYSRCIYTKLAIRELIKDYHSNLKGNVVVLDSRNFNSVGEMECIAKYYAAQSDTIKVIVILNRRFIKADREEIKCGINIHDSISRWGFTFAKIVNDNNSLQESLRCLKKYSGNIKVPPKSLSVMSLIARGNSVHEIAKILNINIKTVYSHATRLKSLFHQTNINHLYLFLKESKSIDESYIISSPKQY